MRVTAVCIGGDPSRSDVHSPCIAPATLQPSSAGTGCVSRVWLPKPCGGSQERRRVRAVQPSRVAVRGRGTVRALAIQTMDGHELSDTSPSVVAPGMASVEASKYARD